MKAITGLYGFLAFFVMASFIPINGAIAQNVRNEYTDEKDYVLLFGEKAKDTAVVKVLYENAPKYFNAPDMPRFAIIGNQHRFYLGIGGYVKGTLSYDFGNPIKSAVYFEPSTIPMDNPAGNGTLVQMSVATSNLFFNFVGLPKSKHKIGAYINFNLTGTDNQYGFNLRAAYLTYRGFTAGFSTSLFTDAAACAPTIDQQGPNAWTFVFNTVLDYQHKFNEHWSMGVGLELPTLSATYNNYSYAINQRIPDIPFYAQYSWKSGNGWARVSGLFRNMYYRNSTKDYESTKDNMGFGVKLSGAVPIGKALTLFYQGVYGTGISSYIQDIQGYGLDMVPVTSGENSSASASKNYGKLKNVESWGAYLGAQYQLCPQLLVSATYSLVNTYLPKSASDTFAPGEVYKHSNSFMPSTTYKQAHYFVANIFCNITSTITTGIEYLWGNRKNVDDTKKNDSRIQTVLRINF